jgi:DivIVA domain-containing protein
MGVIVAVLVGIAVLTGIAVVLAVTGTPISDEPVDRADPGLPDGALSAADIPGLRFRIGLRGYRMDDVDAALERIRASFQEVEVRAETPVVEAKPAAKTRARRRPVSADADAEPSGEG